MLLATQPRGLRALIECEGTLEASGLREATLSTPYSLEVTCTACSKPSLFLRHEEDSGVNVPKLMALKAKYAKHVGDRDRSKSRKRSMPSRGDIRIRGRSQVNVPPEKRNLGLVFQNYALFPHMLMQELQQRQNKKDGHK